MQLKEVTSYFSKKNIIFKDIKQILPKELNSRKKFDIYIATTIDLTFYAIFILEGKSRFIKKNADELLELTTKLANLVGHNFRKKELLIKSPLCSKAKEFLKQNEWSVRVDFM